MYTFLLASDVEVFLPQANVGGYYNTFAPLISSIPWGIFDKYAQFLSIFEMSQISSYYSTAVIYSFSLWMGLFVLFINWLLKNLL